MNKSTKGSIAAAAAAVLLLGGGTSLAYWTASADVDGGAITAGELKLTADACDTNWVYATGQASAGSAVTLWVPGDVVTKSCTYTVTATGDNLLATLVTPTSVALTSTSAGAASTESATATASYTLNNAALVDADTNIAGMQISEASADRTLKVTFQVTFPYGDATAVNANDTQGWEADFDAITVSLTQLDPNP
ncbi:MAG: alternate-type signal peptide domain-containing protein [Arachnia sp.]